MILHQCPLGFWIHIKNYAKYNHGLQPVRWANDIPSEVPFFKILFGNNSHTPTTHLFNV